MKRVFLIALSLTAHHIIAMDKPAKTVATQTNNNAALDEIVANIDKSINEKHLRSSLFDGLSITSKTPYDYFSIITTAKKTYPAINLNEALLDKLYARNSIFAEAIDHFTYHNQKNFEQVTPDTLNTINHYDTWQPILNFNTLDSDIKKYILQRATNKIEHEYTIKIVPGAPVIDFDICPATDTVAISTGDKQSSYRLRLWDLKRVAPLHTFEENNPVNFVCFNAPGNQLATLVAIAGKSKIKIWNPQSKQLLHTIDPTPGYNPEALVYNNHATNYLLHAISRTYTKESGHQRPMETWLMNTEHCLSCAFSGLEIHSGPKIHVWKKPYRASNLPPDLDVNTLLIYTGLKAHTLDITKSNCSDLYLCEQAIKKAQTKQSLNLIIESNPFKTATVYEQALIRELLGKKRNQLTS